MDRVVVDKRRGRFAIWSAPRFPEIPPMSVRPVNQSGLTITELMIAVALFGIGILGSVAAFNAIHRGIQSSKTRTLASNIAQEKMQIVMQKPYYEVLVTTAPAFRVDFTPPIPYDSN